MLSGVELKERTPAERAAVLRKRRTYERNYRAGGVTGRVPQRTVVPDDVERREFSEPCFACGVSGDCRHRGAFG